MTTAAIQASEQSTIGSANERQPLLPFRGDTLLGVCEATGQELGFNPNWLRVAFATLLMWNPEVIVAAYLGLGIVVALTRWLLKDRTPEAVAQPLADNVDITENAEELLAA